MRFFGLLATLLCFAASVPAVSGATTPSKTKAPRAPKEPKKTAANMVEQETSMPSPIKPLLALPPAEMAARFFREALAPYGEWVEVGQFGRCWKPSGVGQQWAPYSVGHWAYSRFGWTWVTSEEFGGIVYHYGRWVRSREHGWCWVPDLEWAASWVSWRYGTETVGWCALPPSAKWDAQVGIGVWADREYELGPLNYVFCPIGDMAEENLSAVRHPAKANVDCFQRSVSVTNLSAVGSSVFCGGPAYNWVAARTRNKIPVIRVIKERSLVKFREQLNEATDKPAAFRSLIVGDRLTTVAPEWGILADPRRADALGFNSESGPEAVKVVKWTEGKAVEEAATSGAVKKDEAQIVRVKVVTGWEDLQESDRVLLRAKIAKEVGGLTPANTPAAPFDPDRDYPTVR